MNKNLEILVNESENLGWEVSINDTYIEFRKFSPAGQDFSFCIGETEDIEEIINSINAYHEDYDVSYEAYLWLDNDGHGANGAPHDMKDVYEDMEACKDNVQELYDTLSKIDFEDEE